MVILLVDDLGYHDLGVQGMTDIPTPNIDRLAHDGVRFTDGYVVSPLCSPSRAGILTGRYPERWGQELNPGLRISADSAFAIPRTQPLLSEELKSLGYATGLSGKWHEGFHPENLPTARGFDAFFGFLGPVHRYDKPWFDFGRNPLYRGTTVVKEDEFLTDAFAREAIRFIDQNSSRPFFLYVPFNAVHEPLIDDVRHLGRVRGIKDQTRRRYASLLVGVDDAIGKIIGELERKGLTRNTLIVFLSDNGGPTASTSSLNTPLAGGKAMVFEGGIRVPFIMKWPDKIPKGSTYRRPVSALDIMPTVMSAVANRNIANLDGVDLMPFVLGQRGDTSPHESLFWRLDNDGAVRQGAWKMVSLNNERKWRLFNLEDDIGETHNVASAHPDIVQRLASAYKAWESEMIPPKWGLEAWRQRRGVN